MPKPRLTADQAALNGSAKVNAGRFADRQSMPPTTGEIGLPPGHLPADCHATWKEISTAIPAGIAGAADRIAVELATRLLQQFRTDPDMQASRIAILTNLLSRLGLDPQARTRLHTPSQPDPDDSWQFLATPSEPRSTRMPQ